MMRRCRHPSQWRDCKCIVVNVALVRAMSQRLSFGCTSSPGHRGVAAVPAAWPRGLEPLRAHRLSTRVHGLAVLACIMIDCLRLQLSGSSRDRAAAAAAAATVAASSRACACVSRTAMRRPCLPVVPGDRLTARAGLLYRFVAVCSCRCRCPLAPSRCVERSACAAHCPPSRRRLSALLCSALPVRLRVIADRDVVDGCRALPRRRAISLWLRLLR